MAYVLLFACVFCADVHTVYNIVEPKRKTIGEWQNLLVDEDILTRSHECSRGVQILSST